jgi:hypothetical protein
MGIDSFRPGEHYWDVSHAYQEHSGHHDVLLTSRAMDDLIAARDSEGRPSLAAPFELLMGAPVEIQPDGSAIWRLASQPSEVLRLALLLLRHQLRGMEGWTDAVSHRLEVEVCRIEAARQHDRVAILRAIEDATSVADMQDRLAVL